MTITTNRRLGALVLVAVVAIGACTTGGGSSAAPTSAASAPSESSVTPASPAPGGVSGSITVSGSSTVEPISTGVAEVLKESNPDFNYTIEGPGTGDGFKRFCAGETDISDASRKIKAEGEADVCAAAGIEYVELAIAYDGITVMTSPDNTAVECLSFADLYALIGPESTGFAKWSDGQAIATELGSTTTFPDATLEITGPGEESGTFDSFVELVIAKGGELHGIDARYGALNVEARHEISFCQCTGGKADWFHQKTPKSRINLGSLGCASKKSLVTPSRKVWLASRSPS